MARKVGNLRMDIAEFVPSVPHLSLNMHTSAEREDVEPVFVAR